jgi:integrase
VKGHIEKRGQRWWVSLELDPTIDPDTGARIRRRRGGGTYRTRRGAEEALRDALDASRRGWQGPDRVTVGGFLVEEWLPAVELRLAPTTAALYRTLMTTYVIPRLGGVRLEQLTAKDITGLYRDLLRAGSRSGGPLRPKTVRGVSTTLRRALADAMRAGHIAWNPADAATAPKAIPTKEPKAWGAEELRRFLDHVSDDRLGALWLLAASTGMRRGELLGLRWIDVDLDAARLRIRETRVSYGRLQATKEPKTERSRRSIPMSGRCVGALRAWRRSQAEERLAAGAAYSDQGIVFSDELGGYLSPSATSAAFRRTVKAASLPPITLHGLRHTFATLGLEAGVDVLYVSELLGHSTPAITQAVYQHVRPGRLEAAIDTISAAIDG